jgi:ABC-type Zn uptake system ZnuABC Zn-binding protein ZnuA
VNDATSFTWSAIMKQTSSSSGPLRFAALLLSGIAVAVSVSCAREDSSDSDHLQTHEERGAIVGLVEREEVPDIQPIDLRGRQLQVVATTSFIEDIARAIAGEAAQVTGLIPRGVELHGYEPTPRQMAIVTDTDLVLINGLGLEGRLVDALQESAAYVVPVSAQIEDPIPGDPHVWMSPRNVISWVTTILDVFSAADPVNAERYRANAHDLSDELDQLDARIRSALDQIPTDRRVLVIDHYSLGYLARDYGLTVVGVLVGSTSSTDEPSARELAELVTRIDETGVRAIFIDSAAAEGVVGLAESVGAEADHEVRIVPILTSSLSPPGSDADNYVGFVLHNVAALAGAMGE